MKSRNIAFSMSPYVTKERNNKGPNGTSHGHTGIIFSLFQQIPAYYGSSSLFQPIQTNSNLFQPIQTYSLPFKPIQTYPNLFMPIPANYSLLQHIAAYSSLLIHIFSLFKSFPAHYSPLQPIIAYSSPLLSIQDYSIIFQPILAKTS